MARLSANMGLAPTHTVETTWEEVVRERALEDAESTSEVQVDDANAVYFCDAGSNWKKTELLSAARAMPSGMGCLLNDDSVNPESAMAAGSDKLIAVDCWGRV